MTAEPASYVGAALTAVRAFDQSCVCTVLDEAADDLGLDLAVDEVLLATLRVLGTFWSGGTVDVAHEHLLSGAVARWVAARTRAQEPPTRTGQVLLAAGPQDQHTLALDSLGLLLAARGVEVCNLGAQTPVSSVLVAVEAIHPSAIVLTSHTPSVASQAVRAVAAIAEAGYPVYFAGASFASQFLRQRSVGTPLDDTLAASADHLTRRHTSSTVPAAPRTDAAGRTAPGRVPVSA